ncbi:uncharacterized protein LOC131217452 [Magnolia sinica]|uniref:uncharacterized protein LOC131217452 n=1 Tax=Magnolia sinica TaxID=86752 RepID=UPI002657D3BB|nr:uncharacterized protein LOC131217452 [Magnolia sinica]
MEGSESVLEAIYEEEEEQTLEEGELEPYTEDAEMLDAETLDRDHDEKISAIDLMKDGDDKTRKQEPRSKNWRRRAKKKNKKNKNSRPASNIADINRFVIDTCRNLKEKKSYLVWNAVGVLGASVVSDLVKEVDTIQGFGGQLTTDGKRFRTGGGILWNILKTREPRAYKEIMARGKEFEKQFRQKNIRQMPKESIEDSSQKIGHASDGVGDQVPGSSQPSSEVKHEHALSDSDGGRVSALKRIRVPVSYDDLFGENMKDQRT